MYKSGTFVEETEDIIRKEILPSILITAYECAGKAIVADELMCDLLKDAQEKYNNTYYKGSKINSIRMSFNIPASKLGGDATSAVVVGPITILEDDTVETLAIKIKVIVYIYIYIYILVWCKHYFIHLLFYLFLIILCVFIYFDVFIYM